MPANTLTTRLGIFAKLAEVVPGPFGRTSLMKLCFFLQTLCDVPLCYDFSLYSYGPFDSTVLADLETAENVGVLRSSILHHPGGYGYDIEPWEKASKAKDMAADTLTKYEKQISWVVEKFGNKSASDLELLSTIVFINQEGIRQPSQLRQSVKSVKPHFSDLQIERQIRWLQGERLLSQPK